MHLCGILISSNNNRQRARASCWVRHQCQQGIIGVDRAGFTRLFANKLEGRSEKKKTMGDEVQAKRFVLSICKPGRDRNMQWLKVWNARNL